MNPQLLKPSFEPERSTISLPKSIELIKSLPDRLMHRHGVEINYNYGEDNEFFRIARETYWAIGLWLELRLLQKLDTLLAINTSIPPNCYYEPLAIRAKAFYDLGLELYILAISNRYPESLNWIADANLTPQTWLLLCESHICERGLKNSYYGDHTVNSLPAQKERGFQGKGKNDLYASARDYYSRFTEENIPSLKSVAPKAELTWIQLLEVTAAAIAQKNSQFRVLHFLPYRATQLRAIRAVKNSPYLQAVTTNPDGSLEVRGRGQRGGDRGRRKGKGN